MTNLIFLSKSTKPLCFSILCSQFYLWIQSNICQILCYCVLLPCFSLLTHNACPTYSWFSEWLLSPSKGCLMWPRRSSKVHNGWKRVQTVPNFIWRSFQKRWGVLTENVCLWETGTTFNTRHICSKNVLFDALFSKNYTSVIAVTDLEKRRLQDAFRRSSAANNSISKQVLIRDKQRPQWRERWECSLCSIGFHGSWSHCMTLRISWVVFNWACNDG